MAVTNTASSQVIGDARYHPVANLSRWFQHVTTATLSSGDVIFHPMWRVPRNACIIDVKIGGRTVDGTTILNPCLRYYDSASAATDVSFGTVTLSVSHQFITVINTVGTGNLPYKVDVIPDDSASPFWAHLILKAQAAASGTGSTSIDFVVTYMMNK